MEVVKQLSNYYGFDMQEALVLLNIQELPISQPDNPTIPCRELNQEEMIKPFDGTVYDDQCKAIVYNHGLYTQCPNICSGEYCSSICKKQKYGHINTRKNFPKGTYVLHNGKKELPYSKVCNRLKKSSVKKSVERIYTEDSGDEIQSSENKPKRGRPKNPRKITTEIDDLSDSDESVGEEIEVKKIVIGVKEYLKSVENILYDIKSHKVVGKYLELEKKIIEI